MFYMAAAGTPPSKRTCLLRVVQQGERLVRVGANSLERKGDSETLSIRAAFLFVYESTRLVARWTENWMQHAIQVRVSVLVLFACDQTALAARIY